MPKRIISKSEKWPGSVLLADPLTLPQVEAIEAVFAFKPTPNESGNFVLSELDKVYIPAILQCTEKIELDGFPPDATLETWPLTPRLPSHDFIVWLWRELVNIYTGETEIPNA